MLRRRCEGRPKGGAHRSAAAESWREHVGDEHVDRDIELSADIDGVSSPDATTGA
jgi:hypothetical protein